MIYEPTSYGKARHFYINISKAFLKKHGVLNILCCAGDSHPQFVTFSAKNACYHDYPFGLHFKDSYSYGSSSKSNQDQGFGRKREKFSRPPATTDIIPDAPPPLSTFENRDGLL